MIFEIDLHDLLDELNDFKNALVKLSSVFTNQTNALNRNVTRKIFLWT